MPAGRQEWDAQGRLTLDLTDRLGKMVAKGQVSFSQSVNAATISVPGVVDSEEFYVSCTGWVVCRLNNGSITLSRYEYASVNEVQYWTVIRQ